MTKNIKENTETENSVKEEGTAKYKSEKILKNTNLESPKLDFQILDEDDGYCD